MQRFNIKSHGFSLLNYKYSRANSSAVEAPSETQRTRGLLSLRATQAVTWAHQYLVPLIRTFPSVTDMGRPQLTPTRLHHALKLKKKRTMRIGNMVKNKKAPPDLEEIIRMP